MASIYDIAENFRKALLARDAKTAGEIIKAYQSVLKNLDGEFRSLHKQITKSLLTGQPLRLSWLWERGDRLNALEQQILSEIQKFSQIASGIVSDAQTDLAEMGQTHATKMIEQELKGLDVRASVNVGAQLNRGAVEAFVGFASDGSPLADLFNSLGPIAARKVRAKLVSGITLGWGADRIAREMKDSFGGNLGRALTVARTESLRAYRESSLNTYKDNSDVVEGWIWMSARNSRTCAVCWAMHGTLHSLDERLGSHPNCRCFMLPVVKGVNRKIETGEELFAKLSPKEQQEILGREKFIAYKKRELKLNQLVEKRNDPRWGVVRSERSLRNALNSNPNAAQVFQPTIQQPLFSDIEPPTWNDPQNITVYYQQDSKDILKKVMGRKISDTQLAKMVGALDDSHLEVSKISDDKVTVKIDHSYIEEQQRTIARDNTNRLFIHNDYFITRKNVAPKGTGIKSFLTEVIGAREMGVSYIHTYAAGNRHTPEWNGYYTWARFGYNAPLKDHEKRNLPPELRGVEDLNQLMLHDGHEWWKQQGSSRDMYFNLKKRSTSIRVLKKYLKSKGIAVKL